MLEKAGEVVTVQETKQFEWRIRNFSAKPDFNYESPLFSASSNLWQVGLRHINRGRIVIDIRPIMEQKYSVEYVFGLRKHDGTEERLVSGILEKGKAFPWSVFIEKSELIRRKSELMPFNIITITCTLKWVPKISPCSESTETDEIKLLKLIKMDKLSEDFKDLFQDEESFEECCDVILKVQNREFKAHKFVLKARSSVFASTFKYDTLERQTGVITIPDCDSDSFQIFLEYLYCGKVEKCSVPNALNLYYTSDKYDVDELKVYCVEYLMQSLNIENFAEIATFANKYNETQLFSAVKDLFNVNLHRILDSDVWEDLLQNDYRVANILLKEITKVKF